MSSLFRAALAASHLAILGLGAVVGFQSWPEKAEVAEPAGTPERRTERARTGSSFDFKDPSVLSAAWESLKDRRLPVGERLGIQHALLREWSVVDFEAAIRAVFAESPRHQDKLLESCLPGIRADPAGAWKSISARAFGWETARVRTLWIGELIDERHDDVLATLPDMSPAVRANVLLGLASQWEWLRGTDLREAVWSAFQSDSVTAEKVVFPCIAGALGRDGSPPDFLPDLLRGSTPAERRLAAAAFGISLGWVDPEDFESEFAKVPEHLRGEVVAATLAADDDGVDHFFHFACLAVEAGDYDALAAAAEREGFRDILRNVFTQAEILDWALTLPEDPRVIGVFRQAVEAASEHEFEEIGARVLALPPGLKRDHGLAAILKSFEPNEEELAQLDELLDAIADPDIRAAALEQRRRQQAE